MVDLQSMSVSSLSEMVEAYPWFASARARLCVSLFCQSGTDASEGQFRSSMVFFPDAGYVASRLRKATPGEEFSDADLADMIRSAVRERPRVYMAGMDYFSKDDYDAVRRDADSTISRIAVVDSSNFNADVSSPAREEKTGDFVTETLARIYAEQGYPDEAVDIYNKLSLQSPEKSAYFATLIDKLKN